MKTVHNHFFKVPEEYRDVVERAAESREVDYSVHEFEESMVYEFESGDGYREMKNTRTGPHGMTVQQLMGVEFHNFEQVKRRLSPVEEEREPARLDGAKHGGYALAGTD